VKTLIVKVSAAVWERKIEGEGEEGRKKNGNERRLVEMVAKEGNERAERKR
jgi:hypothetical protein